MALRGSPSLLQQLRSVLAAFNTAAAAGTRSLSSEAVHAATSSGGSRVPADGLTLKDFVSQGRSPHADLVQSPASTSGAAAAGGNHAARTAGPAAVSAGASAIPVPHNRQQQPQPRPQRTAFIETYGCQMNSSDSEVVLAVLAQAGYTQTLDPTSANVAFLNTCAIRENAEAKVGVGGWWCVWVVVCVVVGGGGRDARWRHTAAGGSMLPLPPSCCLPACLPGSRPCQAAFWAGIQHAHIPIHWPLLLSYHPVTTPPADLAAAGVLEEPETGSEEAAPHRPRGGRAGLHG